jgi:hypothetical protein
MQQQGIDNETIRKETGWFLNPMDRMWRFEIDDSNFDFIGKSELEKIAKKDPYNVAELPLKEILKDDRLLEEYPELNDITVYFDLDTSEDGGYMGASWNAKEKMITLGAGLSNEEMKSGLLHEIQHAIQDIEGFAMGSSQQKMKLEYLARQHDFKNVDDYLKTINELALKANTKEASAEYERLTTVDNPNIDFFKWYQRAAGEIEARDTQARMGMTAAQRREASPYISQGIPAEDAIVRFGSGVAESRQEPQDTTAIFKALDSRSPKATRDKALSDIMSNPNKDRIMYINDNFIDILSELEQLKGFKIEC